MGETLVFRSTASAALTIGVALVAAAALVYFVSTGGWYELWASGPTTAALVAIAWALLWNPRIIIADGGITIVNIMRTTHVPWPRFTGVSTKWALTVEAGPVKVTSWAIPARSGMAKRVHAPSRSAQTNSNRFAPTDKGANADSVALAIATRHRELKESGFLQTREYGPKVSTTLNRTVTTLVTIAVILALGSLLSM